MFVSYSQNFEDLMLWRALKGVGKGFYIDVGAQDPVVDSVSLAFHEIGWEGVSVEPSPQFADLFRERRPHEILEQVVIGAFEDAQTLYEFKDTGLSTADPNIALHHQERGYVANPVKVPSMSLDTLLEKYNQREIHWLKIDVEGLEESVLRSWSQSSVRPWILLIEAVRPGTPITCYEGWEPLVLNKGYEFAYFDGVNRFYVHQLHKELHAAFAVPPNVFDNFSLSGLASHPFCSIPYQQQKNALFRAASAEAASSMLEKRNTELAESLRYWYEKTRQRDADYAALYQRYTEINASYEAIRSSGSWRITRPLRRILKQFLVVNNFFRDFVKRCFFGIIGISKVPVKWLMLLVLKNYNLSTWLNALIQKYPSIHKHLRQMAIEAGFIYVGNVRYKKYHSPSLTPRAAAIESKLSFLLAQHRKSNHAHRN